MASPIKNVRPSVLWWNDKDKYKDITEPYRSVESFSTMQYIAFAATMEEVHTGQASVSKYPVQNGYMVSNHMIRQNRIIQLRAYIPETTLGGIDPEGAQVGAGIGAMAQKYLGLDITGATTFIGGVITDPFGVAENYIEGAIETIAAPVRGIANAVDKVTGWVGDTFEVDIGTDLGGLVGGLTPTNSRTAEAFKQLQDIQAKGILCRLGTVLTEYDNLALVKISVPTTIDTLSCMFVDLTFEEVIVVDTLGNIKGSLSTTEVTKEGEKNIIKQGEKFFDGGIVGAIKDVVDPVTKFGGKVIVNVNEMFPV